MKRRLVWLVLLSALILALGAQTAFANVSGAIFTTMPDGSRVNANIYESKDHVYLDGGPGPNAPAKAAALDEGWYYFQVTDPSGKTLLSQDAVKYRKFYVSDDGVITMAYNHPVNDDLDRGADFGAKVVKLMPYKDTPNPGGVYKVWATPVDKFKGDPEKVDTPGAKFHGFDPAWSKTDNFKVKGVPEQRLIVKKFWDSNANGVWDEGEYEVFGWPVKITEPTGVTQDPLYTRVDIISQLTGVWNVTEYAIPAGCELDWMQTALYVDGVKQPTFPSVNVKFGKMDGEVHTVVFGNVPKHTVKAHKFNDKNGNGKQDAGEEDLANVKFTLSGSGAWGSYGPVSKMTDADGMAVFSGLWPGTYALEEEVPEGWLPTTPTKVENIKLGNVISCSAADFVKSFGFGNVKKVEICATKFFDVDGDGVWDADEKAVPGWKFKLTGTDLMGNVVDRLKVTEADGKVCFKDLYPGDYTLEEMVDGKWLPSGLWYSVDGAAPVTLKPALKLDIPAAAGEKWDVTFGNTKPGCIEAYKYWDKNADGDLDDGEPAVEGWEITLKGKTNAGVDVEMTKKTDANGYVKFCDLWPGTYDLIEEKGDPDVWFATGPVTYEGIVIKAEDKVSKTFLNCKYTEITVCKYEDKNGNGMLDEGEPVVEDFSIRLQGPNGYDETKKTGANGCVTFDKLKPGKYTVTELIPDGSDWKPTALYYRAKADAEFVKADGTPVSLEIDLVSGEKAAAKFLNCRSGCILVEKFYDANKNGTKEAGEKPVAGIKIELYKDGVLIDTKYTDAEGKVEFCELKPGLYTVREVLPPKYWYASTQTSYEGIQVLSGEKSGPYLFGNYCEDKADFGTKGWWQNNNGNPLIRVEDIAALNALDPYDDPTEYWDTPFADRFEIGEFINNNVSASSHRFQLAQQLCAFILNVRIYAGGEGAMIYMGEGPVEKAQDLIDDAIVAWQTGDPAECSKWIKKLDGYNNCDMVGVVKCEPCPVVY